MALTDRLPSRRRRLRRLPTGPLRLRGLGLGGRIGAGWLSLVLLIAILAPLLAPDDPTLPVGGSLEDPSGPHWLGTDQFSRDVLSRLIYGARVSIGVGLAVTVMVFVVGSLLGLLAAYYGRWVDAVIGRVCDLLMAIPGILLAITIIAVLGGGLPNVILALSLTYLPELIRVVRGQALSVRSRMHVRAATAIGAGNRRIILRHIAPFVLGPTIVQATFVFAHAMLYESALSFLGLGIQPPNPTWGNIIADALPYLSAAPLQVIFPSVCISTAVLAVNLLGDSLRDLADPEGSVSR